MHIKQNTSNDELTYKWEDSTNVEVTFINNAFCDGYNTFSIYQSSNNYMELYTFIDPTENCWKYSINSSLELCYICGPTMFDITGIYWIGFILTPSVLGFFLSIYSIYIFVSLYYNLHTFKHNWMLHPTKKIN